MGVVALDGLDASVGPGQTAEPTTVIIADRGLRIVHAEGAVLARHG